VKEDFNSIADFTLNLLEPDIDLLVIDFIGLEKGAKGYADYCEQTSTGYIEINRRLGWSETIHTLIHEIVHVKQYSERWLTQTEPQLWMGQPVRVPYLEREWEIDAYNLEKMVITDYLMSFLDKEVSDLDIDSALSWYILSVYADSLDTPILSAGASQRLKNLITSQWDTVSVEKWGDYVTMTDDLNVIKYPRYVQNETERIIKGFSEC
jgi:hypothetical protein